MRPPPGTVHDWLVQPGTPATLAAGAASWWLIVGLLCGVVALAVAGLLVWRGDDEPGDDEPGGPPRLRPRHPSTTPARRSRHSLRSRTF